MFGFKKKVEPNPKPKCNHKWKDFPWYVDVFRWGDGYRVKVCEPYVCIFCKERKNVQLWVSDLIRNKVQALDLANKMHKEYAPRTQDQVIVEDQIADMQLVDRDYLEMYNKIIKGE